MKTLPKAWLLSLAGTVIGCASSPTGPSPPPPPRIEPGLYVLSEIGGIPAPFVLERSNYGNNVVVTVGFAFDSIRILNDTGFTRHFRRELVVSQPPVPPIVQQVEEFSFGGIILDRADEIKLTVTSGPLPGGHELAYFVPLEGGAELLRHTTYRQYQCGPTSCQLLSDRQVTARYERR